MYRRVLPLLLTAVLLLSACTAGQKNMPQKTDEKERTGQPSDISGEGSIYAYFFHQGSEEAADIMSSVFLAEPDAAVNQSQICNLGTTFSIVPK